MLLVLKIKALYDSVQSLKQKFPLLVSDLEQLYADAEAAILHRSWTLASAQQVLADAVKLVTDFANSDGTADAWAAFTAAFKALFA